MRYQEQMHDLLINLAIGNGIGAVLSGLFTYLIYHNSGFSLEIIVTAILMLIFLGGAATVTIINIRGQSVAGAALLKVAAAGVKSMAVGLLGALSGSIFGIFLFALALIPITIIGGILLCFMCISFPLSVIYVTIMYFIERTKGGIDDSLADKLDKLVPIVSGVVTVIILIAMFM